jgi:leader peptidase (prepilin peptidase)/N-methyltransferase
VGGAFGASLAILMLAIAVIDLRYFIIPDELNAAAFVLALLWSCAFAQSHDLGTLAHAMGAPVIRAAMLALALFSLRIGYRWLREREGLGLGDVKLGCVAGAWLDWTMMPIAIEIAALAALAFHLVSQVSRRRKFRPSARLPFGAFLAPAIWVCWLIQAVLFG